MYLFNFSMFPIYINDGTLVGKFSRPLPKDKQTPWKWDEDYELSFSDNDFFIDNNGWKKLNRLYSEFSHYKDNAKCDCPFLVDGGGYFLFLDSNMSYEESKRTYLSSVRNTVEVIAFYNYENYLKEKSVKEYSGISEIKNKIKKIKSSSFYIEQSKTVFCEYDASMLSILLNSEHGHSCWISHSPWVPGKEKNFSGIGEFLEIDFSPPSNNLVVLNGYVDPLKHYLYKANNRVKKAVVTSLDKDNPFEIEYEFEDYVHFSEINFPKAVNKVRFTIKEVYKGEKWDDTCIQAVITRWEE